MEKFALRVFDFSFVLLIAAWFFDRYVMRNDTILLVSLIFLGASFVIEIGRSLLPAALPLFRPMYERLKKSELLTRLNIF